MTEAGMMSLRFGATVMMSYTALMITECQTAQAAQICFQNIRYNLIKTSLIKTRF